MKLTQPLLHSLYLDNLDKNFCFSPYSLIECLASLEHCVNGSNLREIAALIGGPEDLISSINQIRKSVKSYNHFFYAPDLAAATNQKVIKLIQDSGSEIEAISNDLDSFVARVNQIVKEKTEGKITDLITRDDVTYIKFAILNCIYFKADWLTKFQYDNISKPFYSAGMPNDFQTIDFLKLTEDLKYFDSEDYTIVKLPYQNSSVSCFLVLPSGSDYLLINKFDQIIEDCSKTSNIAPNGNLTSVTVEIPPFKVENTFDLISTMKSCGINSIFELNKYWDLLNFDKLLPEAVMNVSTARQKTYFDFTKEGCEAAAATFFCITGSGYFPGPIPVKELKEVLFNKPFFYILLDKNEMKTPIFIGNIKTV